MSEQYLRTKMATMLAMQDDMNRRVDADWLRKNREWYRAIWIECAELMEHHGGWKWWKHSVPDFDQVLLEIVDIWHFGLSMYIGPNRDFDRAVIDLETSWQRPLPSMGFLRDVEALAQTAISERRFLISAIPTLLGHIGRNFDDLYRVYIGKNTLNMFRQDHGYNAGTYAKTWAGREDNEHLAEIIATLASDRPDLKSAVYEALAVRYRDSR